MLVFVTGTSAACWILSKLFTSFKFKYCIFCRETGLCGRCSGSSRGRLDRLGPRGLGHHHP